MEKLKDKNPLGVVFSSHPALDAMFGLYLKSLELVN